MKTVLLVSQKGGCSKTTIAANLGVAAHMAGQRVILINLDPQGTLRFWWGRREGDGPQMGERDISPDQVRSILPDLAAHFDLCIIDTPPAAHDWISQVVDAVDLVLVPVRPSAFDVDAIRPTLKIIREAKADFLFVLTQTPRAKITEGVARGVAQHGRLAPVGLAFRVAYSETAGLGLSVVEYTDAKAAAEIKDLWAYVDGVLTDG